MQLDSYLEIFTTMYGWAFANIIGELITGTGLVVLPFAVILFQAWREAKEAGLESVGVLPLLERAQTRLIIALFVLTMCFATTPITSLSHLNLNYTPPATLSEPAPVTGSRDGGTGSGFDDAMKDASDGSMSGSGNLAYVPAWWYTVMAVSSGINNGIRNGIRNEDVSIRAVENMAQTATIDDPALRAEIQDFNSDCFVPTQTDYMQRKAAGTISAAGLAIIDPSNTTYGPSDVSWLGSQLFRTEPGFYDSRRSKSPVPGFAVDFSRDTNYYNPASGEEPPVPGVVNPEWGQPTCKQWWEDGNIGLRKKMTEHPGGMQKLTDSVMNMFSFRSTDQKLDDVARLAQAKTKPDFVDRQNIMPNGYGMGTSIGRSVGSMVSGFGVGMLGLLASISTVPLMTGLPMIQALVLMGLYMLLPLAVFLSGFSLRVMFYGAMAIFTVKFWAALWFIAQWMDARLIKAMYPGDNVLYFTVGEVAKILFNPSVDTSQLYKRILLNILMLSMFIGLPILWTGMMSWFGVRIGGEISSMMQGVGATAQNSAQSSTRVLGKLR